MADGSPRETTRKVIRDGPRLRTPPNNDSETGFQDVVYFGYDPDKDGVSDTEVKDFIEINWYADGYDGGH